MNYFLLQTQIQLKQESPVAIIVTVIVLVVVVLIFFFASRGGSRGSSASASSSRVYSKSSFRKRARDLGLSPEQIKSLENLIEKYKITDLRSLLGNTSLLDATLKKAIKEVSESGSSDKIKEAHKLTLYRIKQIIERNSQVKQVAKSSNQLQVGQPLTIQAEGSPRYRSRVIANLRPSLAVEVPVDAENNQVRWKRWTVVKIFFWKNNGQGFTFETKLSNYADVKGTPSVLLKHTNSIKQAQQRKYRRKILERPAFFYPVRILATGTGKNQVKKAFVETKNGTLGTILDVSSGGCLLKATKPLLRGELIKVEFETGKKNQITTYGKVVSVKKTKPLGGEMHIMFTKVSQEHLNRINAYVYDF